ncbi:MAG: hypothetical protein E6525_27565 [Klebsiella grimontii]|nr:hypothetical protein [Klebsiella grimontii]
MTTDITELAQSLKRRAASANEFGESLYVKGADVLALVEALEKAQQRIFELESKLANPVQLPKTNGYWTKFALPDFAVRGMSKWLSHLTSANANISNQLLFMTGKFIFGQAAKMVSGMAIRYCQ